MVKGEIVGECLVVNVNAKGRIIGSK